MKHNILKKVLSLLLVICMMASFAGCIPGEEDPTEPSTIETTGPTENTTVPTDGTTAPTDSTDAATSPTEETQAPTEPTEAETNPPETETPNTDPTFATVVPTESPVETFVDVVETVYAISTVNVRSGPSTYDMIVGILSYGESVQRTGIGNKGWSRVDYNGEEAYVYASYLSTTNPAQDTSGYPKTYSDSTCDITITKEWYEDAWCYIAHLQFTDYTRFGTSCANGEYDKGYETTSHAASRLDAIFAVNGCYSAPYLNYTVVRSGELCNGSGRSTWCPAVYSNQNGLLQSAWETGGTEGIAGVNIDSLVESGLVTDTFCFGPPILVSSAILLCGIESVASNMVLDKYSDKHFHLYLYFLSIEFRTWHGKDANIDSFGIGLLPVRTKYMSIPILYTSTAVFLDDALQAEVSICSGAIKP